MADYYVGLISGTSMDGIDAVLVNFDGPDLDVVATHAHPYPKPLREALLAAIREPLDVELDSSGELDRAVGECFRDAANTVVSSSGHSIDDVVAIGSHGQTLRHQPNAVEPFSLQIGNAGIIASGTGITTIADFRTADIAAGGQGAPLVPPFHRWLFGSDDANRVVLNIGGIANLTVLPAGDGKVTGFDTGPGNGLMDAWVSRQMGLPFDTGGRWAASGAVSPDLLEQMLADPYFTLPPPKSTGFEYFNLNWLEAFGIEDLPAVDVQRTLCELSAVSIANAIGLHAPDTREIFVCGGGSHNAELMRLIEKSCRNIPVATTLAAGLDPDWVEAVAFAWLAMRTIHGQPGNLPSVTGASGEVILGEVFPA